MHWSRRARVGASPVAKLSTVSRQAEGAARENEHLPFLIPRGVRTVGEYSSPHPGGEMRLLLTLASIAVIAAPLAAQAPDSIADAMRRRLDAMLRIPQRVEDLRRAGVPDTAVRGVLDVLKR